MFIPSREAVQSLLDLTKYVSESAYYLYEQFSKLVKVQKLSDKFSSFLPALFNFATTVEKRTPQLTMDGSMRITPAEIEYGVDIPKEIPEADGARELTFEITDKYQGEIDRAFRQSNGNYVSEETHAYLDGLLQRWMEKNNITNTKGIISGPNADGDIVRLSASDLQSKMNHTEKGFAAYVQKESGGKYGIKEVTIAVEKPAVVETQHSTPDVSTTQSGEPDAPSAGSAAGGGGIGGGH